MFENLGWWEILVLVLVGMFIFGPERLPKMIADAARFLRKIRQMARNATDDLSRELGTDIDLTDLNPRQFVRKHLLSEEEEAALRRPLQEAYEDLDSSIRTDPADRYRGNGAGGGAGDGAGTAATPAERPARGYDTDAT